MKRFYITPSIFWEIENGKGKFTIAWLFIYLDIKFRVKNISGKPTPTGE